MTDTVSDAAALKGVGAPKGNQNAATHHGYSKRRRPARPHAGTQTLDPLVAPVREAELLLPTLDTIIGELWLRQQDLARHIKELQQTHYADPTRLTITGMLSMQIAAQGLYRQQAATLGRLIKYKDEIKNGGDTGETHTAMMQALDSMAKELGVTL